MNSQVADPHCVDSLLFNNTSKKPPLSTLLWRADVDREDKPKTPNPACLPPQLQEGAAFLTSYELLPICSRIYRNSAQQLVLHRKTPPDLLKSNNRSWGGRVHNCLFLSKGNGKRTELCSSCARSPSCPMAAPQVTSKHSNGI